MKVDLTPHQYRCLTTLFPDDQDLLKAAVEDELRKLKWPHKRGFLNGKPVASDDQGAMASGYPYYEDSGQTIFAGFDQIMWYDDEKATRLKDIRAKLKGLIE